MRAFALIALCSLAVAVSAAPQFGYGYQQQPQTQAEPTDIASYPGGEKYLPTASTTPEPIVRKQFYVVSAPDDGNNEPKQKHLVLGRPQKNYRVVFIKAPGPDNANTKYSAEFAPQDEKTVIYVLSKKADELDASDIATPEPTEPSKPEVFFIKYKTPEEADAAQREIQSEYDKLGGTNEFSDDKAPVSSIVGALDGLTPEGAYNYQAVAPGSQANPLGAQQPIAAAPQRVSYGQQPVGFAPQPQSVQKSVLSQYLPAITK